MNKPSFARYFSRFIDFLMLGLAVGLLGWSGWRAASLSMTHDEASTFLSHASSPFFDILFSPDNFRDANNHVLNTLSVKFFTGLFGSDNEFFVRFGSVLGHLIYLLFSWRLVRLVSTKPMARLAGFVLLNVNLYMLDFFSLARGYGLSLGFMMVAIFYTFRFWFVENQRFIWLAGLAVLLSAVANFTALNFLAVWWASLNVAVFLLFGRQKWQAIFWKINVPPLVISASIALLFGRQIGWMRQRDEFKYGAETLQKTFEEWVANSMNINYHYFADAIPIFQKIVGVTLILAAVSSLIYALFPKNGRRPWALIGNLMLWILIGGLVVQYHWLGTKYLVMRTALMFLPLCGLAVWLALDEFLNRFDHFASQFLVFFFAFFPVYHACRCCNPASTREWYFDDTSREMCQFVADEAKKIGRPVTFGCYSLYAPSSIYYQQTRFSAEIQPVKYESEFRRDSLNEFFYVEESHLPKVNAAYKEVKRFGGWRVLLRRTD